MTDLNLEVMKMSSLPASLVPEEIKEWMFLHPESWVPWKNWKATVDNNYKSDWVTVAPPIPLLLNSSLLAVINDTKNMGKTSCWMFIYTLMTIIKWLKKMKLLGLYTTLSPCQNKKGWLPYTMQGPGQAAANGGGVILRPKERVQAAVKWCIISILMP